MPRSFYIREAQLDLQQRSIVDKRLEQNLVVTGGAGSGKSVLALWKAKAIQERGKSVLYVVKTVSLKQFMKDGVSAVGLDSSTITSFNKCFKFTINEEGEFENHGWKLGDYDYIILDEATDLEKEEVQELIQHCTYFIAFGDNDQQLFAFKGTMTTVEDIAKTMNMNPENDVDYLTHNHRLPKKIARLVVYAHPSINMNTPNGTSKADNYVRRCTNEGTEMPHVFGYSSEEEQFKHIMKIIRNKNGGLKDVGILFRNRDTMSRAYDFFEANDMEVSMIKDSNFFGSFQSDAPKLMTYHGAKGLQFETVFVPNCDGNVSDIAPLYVALTRTYSSLYVMYTGAMPSVFRNAPKNLYETN